MFQTTFFRQLYRVHLSLNLYIELTCEDLLQDSFKASSRDPEQYLHEGPLFTINLR